MNKAKQLVLNLLGLWPALETWRAVRGELLGFDWGAPPPEGRGTFEHATVVIRPPGQEGVGFTFQVSRPVYWYWKLGPDGEGPAWPESYRAVDARGWGRRVAKAMSAPAEPEPDGTSAEDLKTPAASTPEPEPAQPGPYVRPELSPAEQAAAAALVNRMTNSKSMREIRAFMLALVCENNQLSAEVNAHRAALGYEPLPVFHTNGGHK